MSHGRVGRELQHHYNVLLHLLCEHQWGLQEKILFRPAGRDRDRDRDDPAGREGRGATAEEKKERKRKKKSGEAAVGGTEEKKREEKDRQKVRRLKQDRSELILR